MPINEMIEAIIGKEGVGAMPDALWLPCRAAVFAWQATRNACEAAYLYNFTSCG